jgi:hypothetical protein
VKLDARRQRNRIRNVVRSAIVNPIPRTEALIAQLRRSEEHLLRNAAGRHKPANPFIAEAAELAQKLRTFGQRRPRKPLAARSASPLRPPSGELAVG